MTIVIGSIVIFLVFAFGALLAFLFSRLDHAVTNNYAEIEAEDRGYNPALTMGYNINALAPADVQVAEARKESAKLAAALPRGANSRVRYSENPGGKSASTGLDHDPWTATKIAQFHGWAGAQAGIPSGGIPVAAPAAAAPAAAAPAGKIELVPGKDYPYIEMTDDMSADEKRKARIANSKAKSAAMKAAKAAGVTTAAATAPIAAAPAAAAPMAVGIEAPKLVVITDDMPADDKRKARIANSKAKSAFNKALKAAGIDPKTVEIDDDGNVVLPQGAVPAAAAAAPVAAATAPPPQGPQNIAALGIEPPQLVAMTDDMSPDEIRKARISNSKEKSAFNKALKAAGVDPKTVEIGEDGQVKFAEGAAPAAAPVAAEPATQTSAPAASGETDLASLGLQPPQLVKITDDMSPDEKRQARIANSKAKSAFNKALKAAGVDPKSVKY